MVWRIIKERTYFTLNLGENIGDGYQLENIKSDCNLQKASLITSAVWMIWKARCCLTLIGSQWDPYWIAIQILDHQREYIHNANFHKEVFFLHCLNFLYAYHYLFTNASWIPGNQISGANLVIIRANKTIVIACYTRIQANTILEAKFCAVEVGFKVAEQWGINLCLIFRDCRDLKQVLSEEMCDNASRFRERILHAKARYDIDNKLIINIPHSQNKTTNQLVVEERRSHVLSLVYQGLDLPRWLMKAIKQDGFCF